MGTPFDTIAQDAAQFTAAESEPDGVLYVVGRSIDRGPHLSALIHLQGIATTRAIAVAMCRNETYFIAPLPANVALPEKPVSWINIEYPLKRPPGNKQ